ncbi:methyl-accepting chemotaxis protein [Andreprevotia chitinilytica]|uniref:methyl-accepting chemotaxis protein n=1 Tax=Andreprevotia chitinilytica TaxID=396808 RepID=UPI000550AB5D|nr:methyl-accepting chemotaxis protein [Andreprevotia chitinilytica]
MSLKIKAWCLSALVLLALVGIMLIGLYTMKTGANEDNKARIQQLMTSAYSTIVQLENLAAAGKLTDEQAKAIATQILRENKFHKSEYVYVTDEKLVFVATPLDPQLHGTSFNDFKDAQGGSVGAIAKAALDKSGGAMTEYWWNSARDGKVVDLLSVAIQTPKWHWIVGDGVSFAEANSRFWSNARWQVLICLAVAGLVAVVLLTSVGKLLAALGGEPGEVLELVQGVADGDLSARATRAGAPPRSIYGSVVQMRDALRGVMNQLSQAITSMHRTCDEIVGKAEGSNRLVEAQSQAAGRIAQTTDQFVAQTQTAAEQADTARQQSETATDISAKGQTVISSAVSRLTETEQAVGDTQAGIDELAQRVVSISAVIAVIRDVAEQTNLLALNAAIEAARAGEQGRGFAVVADEVRKLAERTSTATKEIGQTINSVQDSSQSAKARMDDMVLQLKEAIRQAREGGEAVKAIRQETEATARVVEVIGQALNEQVESSRAIRNDVDEVAQSTSGTLAAAQGTMSSATSIKAVSDQLAELVRQFRL